MDEKKKQINKKPLQYSQKEFRNIDQEMCGTKLNLDGLNIIKNG